MPIALLRSMKLSPNEHRRPVSVAAIAALIVTALAAGPAAATTSSQFTWGKVLGFSPELAGRDLNGTALNGAVLDGHVVTGVSLGAIVLGGSALAGAWLEEGRLHGITASGNKVQPRDFAGAVLQATVDDGTTLPLYLASLERHPDNANKDVWGYELYYPTAASWQPYCGVDEKGEPRGAIALGGRWSYEEGVAGGGAHIDDPDAITFACEGYALAKCVLDGYKPWKEVLVCTKGQGCARTDLSAQHQACTRALRGDYLGDGTSYTADGTALNLYDPMGVRTDSEAWLPEAEWDADGALCVAHTRLAEYQPLLGPVLYAADCAQGFTPGGGALLISEAAP